MMNKINLIFLFLFLYFPVAACFPQPQNITGKSEVDEASLTWDFGKVKAGEILKHDFVFKNDTSKTLKLKEVHTSCGCTASEVKKKELLPGEEALIEVKFNSKGYSGPVKQFVYVNTDNLDNPVTRYIIKADVVSELYKTQAPAAGG
jgi:hypothetical protein